MSYIITDDKHYKDIAKSIRSKMQTDREYYPKDMALAIDNIPSSADGTDNPVIGIYYTNPNDNGNPTKVKISGWVNPTSGFPKIFTAANVNLFIKQVEFLNCNFVTLSTDTFNGCSSLTTINLPDSVTSISQAAFMSCSSLTTINLPNSVTSIGQVAFNGCSSLTTINLPNSLMSVSASAFNSCSSLKYVTFGDNFNCNNLDLSASSKIERETSVNMFIALADRTGLTAYKLTLNKAVAYKLTDEDKAIPTAKNWTIVYK